MHRDGAMLQELRLKCFRRCVIALVLKILARNMLVIVQVHIQNELIKEQ